MEEVEYMIKRDASGIFIQVPVEPVTDNIVDYAVKEPKVVAGRILDLAVPKKRGRRRKV